MWRFVCVDNASHRRVTHTCLETTQNKQGSALLPHNHSHTTFYRTTPDLDQALHTRPQRSHHCKHAHHHRQTSTHSSKHIMIQEHELVQEWKQRNIRYALPALSGEVATTAQRKYRPRPASSILGITIALTVIGLWALLFWHALFHVKLPDGRREHSTWLHIFGVFFALEFLYTGLFISCHDAMHGTICANRRLNDFLGQLAISLYAWFDYDMLHRKHWEHHNNTGLVGADPDFHHGDPSIPAWFVSFMLEYMSIWQFTKIAWWALLVQAMGCPIQNMLVYMTAAPLLSAFRLFYYGTYVPHHPEPGPKSGHQVMSWTQSRTSQASRTVSFFACYHFDMHWEHHRWPYAPWWDLPLCRQLSGRGPAGKLSACAAAPLGSTLENS